MVQTAADIIPILIGILHSPLPWTYKALVLAPTRELCKQVKIQFNALSHSCHISCVHLGDDISVVSQRAPSSRALPREFPPLRCQGSSNKGLECGHEWLRWGGGDNEFEREGRF